MSYKLHADENGEVEIVKPAGSSFVRVKIPEGQAIGIIESSDKIEKSDKFDGFPIAVNDEYFFPGELAGEEDKSYRDEENDHFKKNK